MTIYFFKGNALSSELFPHECTVKRFHWMISHVLWPWPTTIFLPLFDKTDACIFGMFAIYHIATYSNAVFVIVIVWLYHYFIVQIEVVGVFHSRQIKDFYVVKVVVRISYYLNIVVVSDKIFDTFKNIEVFNFSYLKIINFVT